MKKMIVLSLFLVIGLLSPLTSSSADEINPLEYYDTNVSIQYNEYNNQTYEYVISFDYIPIGYSTKQDIDYIAVFIPNHNDIEIGTVHAQDTEIYVQEYTNIDGSMDYVTLNWYMIETLGDYTSFPTVYDTEQIDRIKVVVRTGYSTYEQALQSDLYSLLQDNFKAQEGTVQQLTQASFNDALESAYLEGFNDGLSRGVQQASNTDYFGWIGSLFGAFDPLFGFQFVGGLSLGVILAIVVIPKVVMKFFGIGTGKG